MSPWVLPQRSCRGFLSNTALSLSPLVIVFTIFLDKRSVGDQTSICFLSHFSFFSLFLFVSSRLADFKDIQVVQVLQLSLCALSLDLKRSDHCVIQSTKHKHLAAPLDRSVESPVRRNGARCIHSRHPLKGLSVEGHEI